MTTSPQIMAHRGDARHFPENSLPALARAMEVGIRHVECDIQINASGSPVMLHDADLQRTHGKKLTVFEHTDGQSPALLLLPEVLELADRHPEVTLYLEVKHDSIDHWGEDFVLEKTLPFLGKRQRHVVFARSMSFLEKIRHAGMPRVGVILREWSEDIRQRVTQFGPDFLVIDFCLVPEGEDLWPGPWQWAVYEIGDTAGTLAWGKRGADFAVSFDCVALFREQQAPSRD
ncbi:MAG: hypothetical protein GXP28_08240 [Planctomycetes bacterium]|nr:hypothetical protein [Planctomycetota bacterium]